MVDTIEILDLLSDIKQNNIQLYLENGRLRTKAPKGAITPILRQRIKANLEEIIEILSNQEKGTIDLLESIPKVALQKDYSLSNAQRRLWVLDQMEENQIAYNMPEAIRLQGNLNTKALEQAIQLLFERHESLRTNFVEERQVIRTANFQLVVQDYTKADQQSIQKAIQDHARFVFDLTSDALLQIKLLQIKSEQASGNQGKQGEAILLFNMHHIISDGWSMTVLIRELSLLYAACVEGNKNPLSVLPTLPIQYKDYAAWQNDLLVSEQIQPLRQFWLDTLVPDESGQLPLLNLPTDYPRPLVKTYQGDQISHLFDGTTLEALKELSNKQGATLFMSLTALVNILLYRYTNQTDILLGTPSAGRTHPDLNNQIGFYINTLVLRNQIEPAATFTTFLEQVKQNALAAFENELYPFDQLVEELAIPRDTSRSPVFDVMIVLQNNEQTELKLGAVALHPIDNPFTISKFDLTFNFAESEEGLVFSLEYNTDLFKRASIERFITHLETLIESVLSEPQVAISNLNILPSKEKEVLLHAFNDTQADFPKDKTLIDLFEEQVQKTPNNIAVVFEEKEITYQALNEQANRVGHYLRKQYDIQADDIIAVQLERSEWMIIAILGILKAGAAYLPIAPDAPTTRTAFMLQDAKAKALLTDEITHPIAVEQQDITAIEVVEKIKVDDSHRPPSTVHRLPSNLAYIIYTSGSTGMPKGVMIEQATIVNYLLWVNTKCLGNDKAYSMPLLTGISFDMSLTTLFSPLLSGSQIIIYGSDSIEQLLTKAFTNPAVKAIKLTPSHIDLVGNLNLQTTSIEKIIIGGATLLDQHVSILQNLQKEILIYNEYGPTEATVGCSVKEISFDDPSISIGQPISNTNLYILDHHLDLVPIGVAGELCIGGAGLARGYLNNPELSAEKFIPHPFKEGERLYKTGDLAYWLPDGNIEFLGRIDHQLKIRGYRIEAGEIEQALLAQKTIQSAVVIGFDFENGKELVAYLVTKEGQTIPDIATLRSFLAVSLPDYMIPSHFVALESLPMTSSGKVNRKALPTPDGDSIVSGTPYEAPRTPLEQTLVAIWEEVLDRSPIGIHDNFFAIGGHSLRAIKLSAQIGQRFATSFPLSVIFQYPSITSMAQELQKEALQLSQAGMQLSQNGQSPIFAFSPVLGLAILFKPLADLMDHTSFYAFDFVASEDRLDKYYQEMKAQQPLGPYTLMGYSAGTNLAFEMVQYLEAKGEVVRDLILIDGGIRLAEHTETAEEVAASIQNVIDSIHETPQFKVIKELMTAPSTGAQVLNRMRVYFEYSNTLVNEGTIQSNIHLLLSSEEMKGEDTRLLWGDYTEGKFLKYTGQGEHIAMLNSPNLERNVAIIQQMLIGMKREKKMRN